MPQDSTKTPPPWVMPNDLATIVAEDGEWEDPSWDPILLTVVGDTRDQGRHIPMAWQLSLWPSDVFFKSLDFKAIETQSIHFKPLDGIAAAKSEARSGAKFAAASADKSGKRDGQDWSALLHAAVAARDPALFPKLHDESDASTCVIWVETEADGKALIETVWHFVHELEAAREPERRG